MTTIGGTVTIKVEATVLTAEARAVIEASQPRIETVEEAHGFIDRLLAQGYRLVRLPVEVK